MSTQATAAVYRHSRSKGSSRLVLLAMADEANDEGLLTAYRRSQSHLASKANVDTGTVGRAAKALVALGELRILQPGNGRASTDYQILLPGLGAEGRQPATPAPAACLPSPGTLPTQPPQAATPISPLLPGIPQSPPTPRAPADPLASFELFWKAYPRSTAKGAARAAWPAAVKAAGGDPAPIIAGAERYARDPNRAAEYTAHASTWLRAERWTDPPLPPRTNGRPGPSRFSSTDNDLLRNQPTTDDPEAF